MGEAHRPYHHGRPPGRSGGLRAATGGEIVEVQGGHIVRSTGRKDRHSKVVTSKGPRDRRVRLSAQTAIQFYDVQDRLGYDRPSKAVDWLIQNAKAAIDELEELPAWRPTGAIASSGPSAAQEPLESAETARDSSENPSLEAVPAANSTYGFTTGNFLPPSLDSDAIANTITSFFPIAATTGAPSSPPVGFQSYAGQAQDLRLSLQSFQDPIFLHGQPPPTTHHHPTSPAAEQAALFSGSSIPFTFDAIPTGWSEVNQRVFPWSAASGETGGGGGGGGYIFTMPPPQGVPLHSVLGQSPFFTTQRGPLQSSNSPHVRAWADPSAGDHQAQSSAAAALQPGPSFSAVGFAAGGLPGFRIPARIQGEDEHDGLPRKPSSAPSASRH